MSLGDSGDRVVTLAGGVNYLDEWLRLLRSARGEAWVLKHADGRRPERDLPTMRVRLVEPGRHRAVLARNLLPTRGGGG